MRRFFAENLDTLGDTITLTGDEARHIAVVLRLREGGEVLLINGRGEECRAKITARTDESVTLEIVERSTGANEPAVAVTLYQCLPKQGKMETVIQKCVELGVHRIVPTVSRRCVVKIEGKDSKLVRWNKVAQEAAKQCGRAFVPEVTSPMQLDKLDFSGYDLSLIAYENESERTLKNVLGGCPSAPASIAVIIGPEGGFEPEEVSLAEAKGCVAVSLGKRILRTETAGMAMLAQIMYELD